MRSEEDAEDVIQDVWFQLSRIVDLDDIENVGAWLFRVARNRITDLYRKQTPTLLEDFIVEDSEEGSLSLLDLLMSDFPEDSFFKELFWEELMGALEELPSDQRSVFIKNELEDMTLQEIADQSGEKLKTIISRKGYAVKHLRKKLQDLYNDLNNI